MAYRRKVHLGAEDSLALSAATAPAEIARVSWNQLMNSMPFDAVNDNTQRAMPAIFSNLRDEHELPDRDRMRGAFKYAWSKNTGMFHDIRPVIRQLVSEEVPFRVIKGAAIQTLTNRLGARVMGDIDLLIRSSDSEKVESIFLAHGFRANSRSNCSGHSQTEHFDSQNYNLGSSHVDVHIAEVKHPVALFTEMMSRPPVRVLAAGCELQVPEAELLVLHAAVHGELSSGQTDLMQAALDLAILQPLLSQELLIEFASKTRTIQPLHRMSIALEHVELAIPEINVPKHKLFLERLVHLFARLQSGLMETSSLLRRIRSRRRPDSAMKKISKDFRGRRIAYHLWTNWGRFASTERIVMRQWGGFLPQPPEIWLGQTDLHPFEFGATDVSASNVAVEAQDWRFRFKLEQQFDLLWIRVDSKAFSRLDTFVFCNGVPITRVSANDEKSQLIGIRNAGPGLEFSLRPLWPVCEACYSGFSDLAVSMISSTQDV